MSTRESRLVYIYAEYCPGDFYWGWWLYCCGIKYGLPTRNINSSRNVRIWLHHEWQLEQLFNLISLPFQYKCDRNRLAFDARPKPYAELFLEKYPQGVVLKIDKNEKYFSFPSKDEMNNICLHRLSARVRELQLLDWKHDGSDSTARILARENKINRRELERITAEIIQDDNK